VGDECKLDTLSKLADTTGGTVERVDPENLTENFANILSEKILATNVEVRVKLHKAMEFRNEDEENLQEERTLLVKQFGNVTENSEMTFEYRLKNPEEIAKMKDVDIMKLDNIPFQSQISYKTLDGMKCVRVITKIQTVSNDKEEMEKNARYDILSSNVAQQAAKFAKKGDYRQAQANVLVLKKKMKKAKMDEKDEGIYKNYKKNLGGFWEDMKGVHSESESEEEDDEEEEENVAHHDLLGAVMENEGENEEEKKVESSNSNELNSPRAVKEKKSKAPVKARAKKQAKTFKDAASVNVFKVGKFNAMDFKQN